MPASQSEPTEALKLHRKKSKIETNTAKDFDQKEANVAWKAAHFLLYRQNSFGNMQIC